MSFYIQPCKWLKKIPFNKSGSIQFEFSFRDRVDNLIDWSFIWTSVRRQNKSRNSLKTLAQFQIGYKDIIGTSFKPIQRIEHGWRSRRWIYWNGSNDRITEFNWNQDQDARKKTIVGYIAYLQIDKRIRKVFVYDDQEMKDHGRKVKEFQRYRLRMQRLRRNGKRKPFKIIVG
jgi:hypothetical protein